MYNETVVAANAVAPIAVTTDFNLYRLDNAPIDVAWPIVKAVNHHHLFGDFRLAFGLIAIRNHAIVDKNTWKKKSSQLDQMIDVAVIMYALVQNIFGTLWVEWMNESIISWSRLVFIMHSSVIHSQLTPASGTHRSGDALPVREFKT